MKFEGLLHLAHVTKAAKEIGNYGVRVHNLHQRIFKIMCATKILDNNVYRKLTELLQINQILLNDKMLKFKHSM
ncbi:hypothetical protein Hanom_Chr07g00598221 [Helianthus anomalus]